MRPIRSVLWSLSCLLLSGVPCLAQERPPALDPNAAEEAGAGYYDTATVEARPLATATAAVSVIDRPEIEASGVATVAELLRQSEGVQILSSGTRGGLTAAQIRGGDPNFTLVLLDGVALNDSTDALGGSVNLETLPLDAIERIEIVRGPLSHHYGSAALAGAINIVTRAAAATTQARASIEGGNGSLLRATGSIEGPLGRARQFWLGSWEREEHRIAEESFEQLHLAGNLRLPLSGESLARVSARVSASDVEDYPESSGGPGAGPERLRSSEVLELSLGTELLLGGSAGGQHRLLATLHGRQLDRDSPGVFPLVPPSTEQTWYWRGLLGWRKALYSGGGLRLGAGADLSLEHGRNESLLRLPPELGGDLAGDYERSRAIPGGFAELLYERGRLLVEAAARVDVPEGSEAQLSPRLGASLSANGGRTRFHASAGSAFKLPSFVALASPPELGGNPELEPETSFGADLGVDHQFGSLGLRTGLTLFAQRFRNLIDFDFEQFKNVNRLEVEAEGAELSLDWKPARSLRLDAALTFLRTEDRSSGEELLHRPEWTGGFRLSWAPLQALTLSLDGQTVSRSLDRQLPFPERDSVEGYGLLGFSGQWDFAERFGLQLRLENLTDTRYETLIGFEGPGRSVRLRLQARWL